MGTSNIEFTLLHPFTFSIKAIMFLDLILIMTISITVFKKTIYFIKYHKKEKIVKLLGEFINSKNKYYSRIGVIIEQVTLGKVSVDEQFMRKIECLKRDGALFCFLKHLRIVCLIALAVLYLFYLIIKQFLILKFNNENPAWFISELNNYLCGLLFLNIVLLLIYVAFCCTEIMKKNDQIYEINLLLEEKFDNVHCTCQESFAHLER